jgi:hypothetical protein
MLCSQTERLTKNNRSEQKMSEFDKAMENWKKLMQEKINKHMAENFPTLEVPKLAFQKGKKQTRVVKMEYGAVQCVYCFIEHETGKIMKPAGFAAPEPKRYERGNIFREDPLEGCGVYGTDYRN